MNRNVNYAIDCRAKAISLQQVTIWDVVLQAGKHKQDGIIEVGKQVGRTPLHAIKNIFSKKGVYLVWDGLRNSPI